MKTRSLAKFHVLLLIVPPILWTVWLCLNPRPNYLSWAQYIFAGLLPISGPYATLLAGLGDLPNAGKLPGIAWPLGLTISLLTVVIPPYVVKLKWMNIVSRVLYVPLILFWVFYGWVQIASRLM